MHFLYLLLMWRIFSLIPFSLLRRTLYSTWRSHYRHPQVLIMIFNKKKLRIENPPWNLLSFEWELLLMTVSKIVSGIVLALLWFRMNSKTIKTLGFTIDSVFSFVLLSDGKSIEIVLKSIQSSILILITTMKYSFSIILAYNKR